MSENGEIYTAGKKFYTPAGTDGMDKFHLWCGSEKVERAVGGGALYIQLLLPPGDRELLGL